jgi:hypothetical protein
VLHPLAEKIAKEFPDLDLSVWYLDDGTIIGDKDDVFRVFELIRKDGPRLGLHLNVKKNEIWWPSRAEKDPFPAEVDRIHNSGVKLLGAPIGNVEFTTGFVTKKLKVLKEVCRLLAEVDDAQIEFGLFRGCLAYNKINHLLRTCPPDVLRDAIKQFDDHFQDILSAILRVPCLPEDTWEHAALPTRFAGLGVTQTKVVAGAAFLGSCALTKNLVAGMLKRDATVFMPTEVKGLLEAHGFSTGIEHDFQALCEKSHVQRLLSDEAHQAVLLKLKVRSSTRMKNLLLACTMSHASDWLQAPPIPGLGLSLPNDNFRAALKFRLGLPLFDANLSCPATSRDGASCGEPLDAFGDHALCCHFGSSRLFRHNNVRDVLGHTAVAAGLTAVVVEKKNQISGSKKKPGDLTVQQYHSGFQSTAFDVTVTHPLQKKHIDVAMEEAGVTAQEAHDRKLLKYLTECKDEGLHFVPLAWESTGGATETVHETIRKLTDLEAPAEVIQLRPSAKPCIPKSPAACRDTWLIDQPDRPCSRAL